jgi:hypothetical protein
MSTNSPTPTLISNPLLPTTLSGSLDLTTSLQRYQFTLTGNSSSARILVADLTGDADLQLKNSQGTVVGTPSKNSGSLTEVLLFDDLGADTYTIEVSLAPNTGVATYKLEVNAKSEAQLSNLWWRNEAASQAGFWQMDGVNLNKANSSGEIGAEWKVQALKDLNADGEDDLVWRNAQTGAVGFWIMKQSSRESVKGYDAPLDWQVLGVADFDGNQQADLLWYNSVTNDIGFWMMNGADRSAARAISGIPRGWKPLFMADVDGDTKSDIIWRNTTNGEVGVWLMNGMNLKPNGAMSLGAGLDWTPQFAADLNKDGSQDLIWRNSRTGEVGFWLMNGTRVIHTWAAAAPTNWQIYGAVDFNGDGASDLLWRGANGEVGGWVMAGDGRSRDSASVFTTLGLDWQIAGIGDFNNDRKTDIVYRNERQALARVSLLDFNATTKTILSAVSKDHPGVGAGWKLQGVMNSEIQKFPFSLSGNSVQTAFNLGTLNDSGKYQDRVRQGENDFFRFNVGVQTQVIIQSSNGVQFDLFRLQQNGSLSDRQVPTANGVMLEAGTYIVQVSTQTVTPTAYTLDIKGLPQVTNIVGTSFSVVQNGLTLTPSTQQTSTGQPNVVNNTASFVTVNFSVKNTGGFDISTFKVKFWISRDGIIQPNGPLESVLKVVTPINGTPNFNTQDTLQINAPLLAGEAKGFTAQLALPDTVDSFWFVDGKYAIGMELDPDNEITEYGESSTTDNFNTGFGKDKVEFSIQGTETTELAGSLMQVTSGTIAPGATLTLRYRLQNLGNKAVSRGAEIPVAFFLSMDPTVNLSDRLSGSTFISPSTATVSVLGGAVSGTPAETGDQTIQLTLPDANWEGWLIKDLYLGMYVNLDKSIPEASYDNNAVDPSVVGVVEVDTVGRNYLKLLNPNGQDPVPPVNPE